MRRREFIILLCGATIPWPRVARSEQTGSVRIGILSPLSSSETTSPPSKRFGRPYAISATRKGRISTSSTDGPTVATNVLVNLPPSWPTSK
jgi:hypothetical protein